MKVLLNCLIGLLFTSIVLAQDNQENTDNSADSPAMWLGGQVTFGNQSGRDFTFGPSFGYMINDRMAVGGSVLYSGGNNSNEWGIEPFFRYYLPVVDQFSFFGDAFIGIGGGDFNTGADGGEYSTFDFGVRAGLQFWFTPKWSMAATTNVFNYQSTDNNGDFGMGINFHLVNFSFFFHF